MGYDNDYQEQEYRNERQRIFYNRTKVFLKEIITEFNLCPDEYIDPMVHLTFDILKKQKNPAPYLTTKINEVLINFDDYEFTEPFPYE